ncbi:MAG: protein phosphatase CheZ [Pseudomonadales bacterium]|nr:protein phosphatase CheZ [Pseudomonadales bacterium]
MSENQGREGIDSFTDPKSELIAHAKSMVEKLEEGSSIEAFKVLEDINKVREHTLFSEVGRLTRSLHSAITNFHIDISLDDESKQEISRISDASDRLGYVIELTETAANKTMDKVEEAIPAAKMIQTTAEELKPEWDKVLKGEIDPAQFRELHKKMGTFIDGTIVSSKGLCGNLSDILLAQDYQDLTGQVIKRVIQLVQELEDSLVELVKTAGAVEELVGIEKSSDSTVKENTIQAEGPIINKEERADVVSGQDDVNDLLSSLGF